MNKKKNLTRRQFLQIIALGSAAGLAFKLGLENLNADEMVSETRLLMGTIINIKTAGMDPRTATAAINATFERMSALESVLSRFQPGSQLSRLNQAGVLHEANPALISLVEQSQELSRVTGGAFDITVKPLLDLYQSGNTLPGEDQIRSTLSLVGYQKLVLDGTSLSFQQTGMSITLDGIAKGFIVDEGVAVLREYGFVNVMVEAGGDLMALGEKAQDSQWRIGLQAPRAEMGNILEAFNVRNQALATSGDYMQAFTPDFANHHILDPRTGRSSPELASVSVIAPTVTLADGLATALMVMGKEGFQLIERLYGCAAYAVTKDSVVLKTSGFTDI